MARMGSSPFFVSAVGTDDSGSVLTDHLNKLDVVLLMMTFDLYVCLPILRILQECKYWMAYLQPRSVWY